MEQESNLITHARHELSLLRSGKKDPMQDAIEANVLKIVKTFADEGHSGSSASYTLEILKRVLAFEPVTPLTGNDDEWCILDYDHARGLYECFAQNKRCSHVFKRRDGTAYDIRGKVFEDNDGNRWTNRNSWVDITFPYTPTTEIVRR